MPNKHNIYLYSFAVSAAFAGLFLVLQWRVGLSNVLINDLFIPSILLSFLFGVITLLPKIRGNNRSQAQRDRRAYSAAIDLLRQAVGNGNVVAHEAGPTWRRDVVRVADALIDKAALHELYDIAPAVTLPPVFDLFGSGKRRGLDWHEYDLCIIAGSDASKMATEIAAEIKGFFDDIRIYLDPDNSRKIGSLKTPLLKRVFYSGSRLCLALISKDVVRDPLRRYELDLALSRATVDRRRNLSGLYLIPIPLDEEGLEYMKKRDKYLQGYIADVPQGEGRRARIVDRVREAIGLANSERVFLSYSHLNVRWADQLTESLTPRLLRPDGHIWDHRSSIKASARWSDSIRDGISAARVVVCLVSTEYIKSRVIVKEEFPWIMEARKLNGTRVTWVLINRCNYEEPLQGISELQAACKIEPPLEELGKQAQEAAISETTKRIVQALHE